MGNTVLVHHYGGSKITSHIRGVGRLIGGFTFVLLLVHLSSTPNSVSLRHKLPAVLNAAAAGQNLLKMVSYGAGTDDEYERVAHVHEVAAERLERYVVVTVVGEGEERIDTEEKVEQLNEEHGESAES